jgi:hypothetical protein
MYLGRSPLGSLTADAAGAASHGELVRIPHDGVVADQHRTPADRGMAGERLGTESTAEKWS